MKRILTILLSLALPAAALAADWFDAGIAGYEAWPTDGSDKVVENQGTWSGTSGATLDAVNHVLNIDAPEGTTVAFTPTASKDAAGEGVEQVVFVSTNTLTAVQPIAQLAPLEQTIKAALAAATDGTATNFYGWAKDPDGATNVWRALTGAMPAVDVATEVRVLFKTVETALQVQYQVNGAALTAGGESWLPVATQDTTLAHAGMRGGNLAVSSLYAFTEDTPPPPAETVVLTLAALPENVTLVSVTTNGVAIAPVEGAYTVYSNATATVTFAAAEGYRLVGEATVDVEMDGDKTLATADMPTAELIPPPPPTATLTIPELPANVSLVSVTTNGVAVSGVANAYTVLSNDTVTVEFAAADGYRLVGDATVDVVMDADKTLSGLPTAELIPIPTATLTIPEPPANVSLVSVTTNGVAVAGVEGAYTVYSNATVVATFAAAEGYELVGDAAVSVVVDGDKTLTGIPAAVSVNSLVKINEIMASNPSVDKGGITNALGIAEMDWVEFYNGSSQTIDLAGWYLSDNDKKGKEDKATILGSCVIPAKGYKIVWLDKIHTNATEYAANEAFAVLKLSSSGDLIQLADPTKAVIDKVNFKDKKQIKGYSYGPLSVVSDGNLVPGNGDPVYMKTATPEAPNVTEGYGDFTPAVTFSEPHGYKTEAFELTLGRADDTNRTDGIYYTLDGTSPTTASILYTNAIPISKTTVIRAAVPVENSILQFDTSATYVFLDDVLAQAQSGTAPASAVGFPNDNAVNGQEMLYGMRQDIVTGSDRDRLLRGFTNSIATLSVVVDPANLFNSTTGIYVNPRGEGVEWERQIMLEGFDPTGVGADFAQPAGIRIRGGYSRRTGKPKHSLRFFFRSSYGESSLAQKMFVGEPLTPNGEGKMKEEAGEYDKLDLRTSQNNSWANNDSPANDTFVTEVFSRDSQRDLGQPYTRSRYYNVFINGQYWGLYQTQERGDEHWAESYLGGDSLQYDVIKTASSYSGNNISYSIECNEGTWDAWSNLWEIATTEGFGPGHEGNYNKVLGLNPDGTRNPAYPILLNAESLMVYMLVSHYVVDRDGPTSPFSSLDKGHPNNFYAIRNRDDAGAVKGFVFLRHDAEMSMNQGSNTGPSNNPTYWGTEECTEFSGAVKHRTIPYFTPAELHYLLMQNPVYKRQYADLFYRECLREGGAMTVENATARYASRMAEIDDAIVCEAARWGQGKTRSTWLSACSRSVQFITNRVGNMKTQYQNAGWYPTNAAPFVVNATGDRYFDGGEVPYQEKVYLQNNEASGTIYYTTNGVDDPMDAGVAYTGGFPIPDEGFTVRARVFKDNEWSALEEVALEADVPNDQRYGIRVAAIQSIVENDPADEFIILTNILDRAVDLKGLSIWTEKTTQPLAILAEFTESTMLPAHGTITLTSERWLNGHKFKNDAIYVELRDYNGKRIQNTLVNAKSWFLTDPGDSKSGACNKTGRWLIALEFLGDTDGGEVILESQWMPSPEPGSDIPLPEDATAKAEVLDAIADNAALGDWLVEISTNVVGGYDAITNFTGTKADIELCYLVDILPDSDPEVELTMPSITFDENGQPVVEGELLNHGREVETTVRGTARLYYADTLEDLATSTDYIQISPPTFPVTTTNDVSGAQIPNARFYRLKIE